MMLDAICNYRRGMRKVNPSIQWLEDQIEIRNDLIDQIDQGMRFWTQEPGKETAETTVKDRQDATRDRSQMEQQLAMLRSIQ